MIVRLVECALRHRALVLVLAGALGLAGAWCAATLPVDALPNLSERQVLVYCDWAGHTPREVEDQITHPLSSGLRGLAGVKAVRATSELGYAMVSVIFDDGVDLYFARQRVTERLPAATAQLPPGVVPYLGPDATALGQIYWYVVEDELGERDVGELRALEDNFVRDRLSAVPGVAEVASVGGFVREYQIDVHPERLRAYGVTLGELSAAVARGNGVAGGGVLERNGAEYLMRAEGWIHSVADVEIIVVGERDGAPLYLRQLASVRLGPAPRRSVLEKDGREVVGGVVVMRDGENPLAVTERVQEAIRALSAALPKGVRVVPFYERTRLVRGAMTTLRNTLLEEMAATALVVLLVIGHARAAIAIVAPLPLAVCAAFVLMRVLGVPANLMSLSGIAISIGVLVDAGIVITENACARLHERFGALPVEGDTRPLVLDACRTVARPLLYATLILVVSFLPVFALTGMEGKMFRPLALTKTCALVGVAVLALTLVPVLLPSLLRGRMRAEEASALVRGVASVYRPALRWLLERPRVAGVALALLAGLGWNLHPRLGREFMPALDEGAILDMPVTSPSVSVVEARRDLLARDAILRGLPEAEGVVGKAGRAETPTDPAPLDMMETVIDLRPRDEWPRRALPMSVFLDGARALLGGTKTEDAREVQVVAAAAAARFDAGMRAFLVERWRAGRTAGERRALDFAAELRARGLLGESLAAALAAGGRRSSSAAFPTPARVLARKTKAELVEELDAMARVPGWGNIWTQPLINRVDMLATGVRTLVGVKVQGERLDEIQRAADRVAEVLRAVPGAADVVADRLVGENYLEVLPDRVRAARYGIDVQAILDTVEVASAGKVVASTIDGRRRYGVRLRYASDERGDEERIARLLVTPTNWTSPRRPPEVALAQVATVRVVDGPSMIKSEDGRLRAWVQLGVRGRDVVGFVEEAERAVRQQVTLPAGVTLERSGEFEHEVRARRTLSVVVPVVLAVILFLLYLTWRDPADALLIFLSVPGALVGGMLFQVIWGVRYSVAVWVGYIACFGLAAETGIIMVVYLRQAVERAGGLASIPSLAALREVVIDGAVKRLRPKLLTEAAAILGLVPMLWAGGTGSEMMRPMAAPVLGGILIADEVIDLILPVLFYEVRRRRWSRFARLDRRARTQSSSISITPRSAEE